MQTFFFDGDTLLTTFLKDLINIITNNDPKLKFQEINSVEEMPIEGKNVLILTQYLPKILLSAKTRNPNIITVIFSNLEEQKIIERKNLDHYILYNSRENFQQEVLLPFEKIYCPQNNDK